MWLLHVAQWGYFTLHSGATSRCTVGLLHVVQWGYFTLYSGATSRCTVWLLHVVQWETPPKRPNILTGSAHFCCVDKPTFICLYMFLYHMERNGRRSFLLAGSILWNVLIHAVRNADSIATINALFICSGRTS